MAQKVPYQLLVATAIENSTIGLSQHPLQSIKAKTLFAGFYGAHFDIHILASARFLFKRKLDLTVSEVSMRHHEYHKVIW